MFTKGYGHEICQDYAITAGDDFVVVCDGCSSGPNTDVGARIYAHEAVRRKLMVNSLMKLSAMSEVRRLLSTAAQDVLMSLGLPKEAGLTTLLIGTVIDDHVEILVMGDGVIVARKRNGDAVHYKIEYPCNAPYYPYYEVETRDRSAWFAMVGNQQPMVEYSKFPASLDMPSFEVESIQPSTDILRVSLSIDEYDSVILSTDGLLSFDNMTNQLVEAAQFRTLEGEFVKRRINKILRTNKHFDDIGVGGIAL
jgi:hypothetical protein